MTVAVPAHDPPSASAADAAVVLRWSLAALLAGPAVLHLGLAPSEMTEQASHGWFFVAAGWAQLGLASWLVLRPGAPWALRAAIVCASLGVAAVWVVSRTAGVRGTVEPVGYPDVLATVLEALAAVGASVLAEPGLRRVALPERHVGTIVGAVVAVVAALVTMAMVPSIGGPLR